MKIFVAFDGTLHPGAAAVLRRFDMDETDVAEAVASGVLASPQRFGNSWYFAIRITGTGKAYRQGLKEHVWRDPALYINEKFLRRCNGLPVIIEHPPGLALTSEEYHDRNVGSIVLPYIPPDKPDEVWGVARILDEAAARYMEEHVTSTSPAVVFRNEDDNESIDLDDGTHVLIEGKPALLDHIAICEVGVWDKSGPPTGVESEGAVMSEEHEEEKKEEAEAKEDRRDDHKRDDRHRDDEEKNAGEKLDKILTGLESVHKRMDAMDDDARRRDDDMKALKKRMDDDDAKRKRDDRHRDDEEGEDKEHAERLEELAKEEREEHEESKEDKRSDKRHDRARHDLHRRDDEAVADHSRRVDDFAKKHRHDKISCRDDESRMDHSRRIDEMEDLPMPPETSADKRHDRHRDDDDDRRRDDRARDDSNAETRQLTHLVRQLQGELSSYKVKVGDISRYVSEDENKDAVAYASAQSRADEVYQQFGSAAPRPMLGERIYPYRVRLLREMQHHSRDWKDTDLAALAEMSAKSKNPRPFENVEAAIYADALSAARNPTDLKPGMLREIKRKLNGREISEFQGEPLAWMNQFMTPLRRAERLSKPPM